MNFTFIQNDVGNVLVVASSGCKMSKAPKDINIATIREPDSKNPLVELHQVFGMAGLIKMLHEYQLWWRDRNG